MKEAIMLVQENPWTCLFAAWLCAIVLHAAARVVRG